MRCFAPFVLVLAVAVALIGCAKTKPAEKVLAQPEGDSATAMKTVPPAPPEEVVQSRPETPPVDTTLQATGPSDFSQFIGLAIGADKVIVSKVWGEPDSPTSDVGESGYWAYLVESVTFMFEPDGKVSQLGLELDQSVEQLREGLAVHGIEEPKLDHFGKTEGEIEALYGKALTSEETDAWHYDFSGPQGKGSVEFTFGLNGVEKIWVQWG